MTDENTYTFSTERDEIFAALAKFQAECPEVEKDATVKVTSKKSGSFLYEFHYATLGNIIRTTKPTLTSNGLSFLQVVTDEGVQTILMHKSGQYIKTDYLNIPTSATPTPQDIGSGITYAKRYQLAAVLGVDAMDDDDGNMASGNDATKTKRNGSAPVPKKKSAPKAAPKKQAPAPKKQSNGSFESILESAENGELEDYKELLQAYVKELNNQDNDPAFRDKYHDRTQQAMKQMM